MTARIALLALLLLAAGIAAVPAQALGGFGVSCDGTLGVSASTDPPGAAVTTPSCAATLPPLPLPP